MSKPKLTKGWLCRNGLFWDTFIFYPEPTTPTWVEHHYWCEAGTAHRVIWTIKDFRKTYSCNFRLPKPGEKVEIYMIESKATARNE